MKTLNDIRDFVKDCASADPCRSPHLEGTYAYLGTFSLQFKRALLLESSRNAGITPTELANLTISESDGVFDLALSGRKDLGCGLSLPSSEFFVLSHKIDISQPAFRGLLINFMRAQNLQEISRLVR
jgi:hypothetical protein